LSDDEEEDDDGEPKDRPLTEITEKSSDDEAASESVESEEIVRLITRYIFVSLLLILLFLCF
jgi:hypothetical protein